MYAPWGWKYKWQQQETHGADTSTPWVRLYVSNLWYFVNPMGVTQFIRTLKWTCLSSSWVLFIVSPWSVFVLWVMCRTHGWHIVSAHKALTLTVFCVNSIFETNCLPMQYFNQNSFQSFNGRCRRIEALSNEPVATSNMEVLADDCMSTRCFIRRTPFWFFHNSLKWWSIYTKFLPVVAEEILIQNVATKYGSWLNIIC